MKKHFVSVAIIFAMCIWILPITAKASSEEDVLDYINAEREANGLEAVTMDEDLQKVAAIRAQECSVKFSHVRPNGKLWSTVSKLTNGENLAHAVNLNQQRPENVVYAWMLSPGHKANVLGENYTVVGISYYCKANDETFVVCEFR